MNLIESYTHIVKSTAKNLGFDYCGIAKATKLNDDAARLEAWLQQGFHGSMQYMEKYFDLRVDPALLVPGAKSVVSLMLNYFPAQQQKTSAPKISKYAYGKDYHEVIKPRLVTLATKIETLVGRPLYARCFVDAVPLLERGVAARALVGAGGAAIRMHMGSVTLPFYPPKKLMRGIFVNQHGTVSSSCGMITASSSRQTTISALAACQPAFFAMATPRPCCLMICTG